MRKRTEKTRESTWTIQEAVPAMPLNPMTARRTAPAQRMTLHSETDLVLKHLVFTLSFYQRYPCHLHGANLNSIEQNKIETISTRDEFENFPSVLQDARLHLAMYPISDP